jgi:hypothetical protein
MRSAGHQALAGWRVCGLFACNDAVLVFPPGSGKACATYSGSKTDLCKISAGRMGALGLQELKCGVRHTYP